MTHHSVVSAGKHKNGRRECVVVFFLDAVRYDYINRRDTPCLYEAACEGVFGPLETILGFNGIAATILTGTYPTDHMVWTQYVFAPRSSPFDWVAPISGVLEKIDQGLGGLKSIRKALRFSILMTSLIRGRATYYPGVHGVPIRMLPRLSFSTPRNLHEKGAFHPLLSLFDLLRHSELSFELADYSLGDSDQKVIRRALRMRGKPDLLYIRLMDLDEVTHMFGTGSPERVAALRETDRAVGLVLDHLQRKGVNPITVIFADHGMIDVEKRIDVLSRLRDSGLHQDEDCTVFLDSTLARFWARKQALERISESLNDVKSGRILTDEDMVQYHLPRSRAYGDLIYLVDPGTIIYPNYYQTSSMVSAMHGYDPSTPGLESIFIFSGRGIEPRRIARAELIDILPTILDVLDIPIPAQCKGNSLLEA